MVKPGVVVMDVGVNRVPDPTSKTGTKLVGDVAFAEVQPIAGKITPNPGGVGPMTIAMLLQNTVRAAEVATKINFPNQNMTPTRILPDLQCSLLCEEIRRGSQRQFHHHRRDQFHPRAATAGGGLQAQHLQSLDGGHRSVYRSACG